MQLKKLKIDSHKHLENIHFDFTYPEGHKNAGKPLEKICIIGQSATGKTTILELVKDSLVKLNTVRIMNGTHLIDRFRLNFMGEIEYLHEKKSLLLSETKIKIQVEKSLTILKDPVVVVVWEASLPMV